MLRHELEEYPCGCKLYAVISEEGIDDKYVEKCEKCERRDKRQLKIEKVSDSEEEEWDQEEAVTPVSWFHGLFW